MFTGLIQALGSVRSLQRSAKDARLTVDAGGLDLAECRIGDSIAVSGVCLSVVDLSAGAFSADVSDETLSRTVLGELDAGARVNLERALTLRTPLGGHLVSGHVDGVGEVVGHRPLGESVRLRIRAPAALARYIAAKGSICVDGVSLTVNTVAGAEFELNIIPLTLTHTTLGEYRVGRRVNLEVDIIARYLERLLLDRERGTRDEEQTTSDQ